MDEITEDLLKRMHTSLCITFGTSAPYSIGHASGEKVGFAQIPSVVVSVVVRDEDLSSVVPVVRQYVYAELAERGWSADDVGFTPSTQRGRRRKFTDRNESSESYGRNRFGTEYRFRFDMGRDLATATFQGFGSFKPIADRRAG